MIDATTLARLEGRRDEIESAMSAPEIASAPGRIKTLRAEYHDLCETLALHARVGRLRRQIDGCRQMLDGKPGNDEIAEMAAAEMKDLEAQIAGDEKDLLFALLPPDPSEDRNILLEIRAGTGCEEAALFAGTLARMYVHYAERRRWKVNTLESSPSDLGGFKEIVFSIEGERVFRDLRYESGVHRVQRVPETEAQGRIHTSAATVVALPEADERDDVAIPPEEIRMDLFRASGPGGQKVNKTESAVRLTHLPTGIVVQSQNERSQGRNKEIAMSILRTRLLDHLRARDAEQASLARRSLMKSGDRSDRIRTYNFPQNRLTDHRIHLTLYKLDRIVGVDLDEMIGALRDHDLRNRLNEGVNTARA